MDWPVGWFVLARKRIEFSPDNADQLFHDLGAFFTQHKYYDCYCRHCWETEDVQQTWSLSFEDIEQCLDGINIAFRSDVQSVQSIFYLDHRLRPRVSFLHSCDDTYKPYGELVGICVSQCVSKTRWVLDADPDRRVERAFLVFKASMPRAYELP